MDYDLRLLQYAVVLAEHRNFARAAKALNVTQPTLSRGIQNLEGICRTRLFDRTSTGAEPTDAGHLFLNHARDLLARGEDMRREMNLVAGLESGDLRIGSGTYPSHMYVDRALCRLIQAHPNIHISIANDNWANLLPLLRRRELDLAVIDVTAAEQDPEIAVIKLQQHRGCLVFRSGHPLQKATGAQPETDSWNYPIVTTSRLPKDVFRGIAEALVGATRAEAFGAKSVVSIACESLPMMKMIAMETDAIAILPLNLVTDEIKAGKLEAVPVPPWMKTNFGIASIAHRSLSPLGATFVELVKEADQELLAWEEKMAKKLFAKPRSKAAETT